MKKLSKKIMYVVLVGTFAILSTGCGPGAPFITLGVVGDSVAHDTVAFSTDTKLTFKVTWTQTSYEDDLVTSLITPLSSWIDSESSEIDGCYSLGTFEESYDQRVSIIECNEPLYGRYDLQIENIGYFSKSPLVEVIEEHFYSPYPNTFILYSDNVYIPWNDTALITFEY